MVYKKYTLKAHWNKENMAYKHSLHKLFAEREGKNIWSF